MSSKQASLVCICVPTYNSVRTLPATFESLLNQTWTNFRIKVFDNASTDGTQDLVRSYTIRDSRVSLITSDRNLGAEGNFTRCLQGGEGSYTAIFHADDLYHPEMIAEQVRVLEADPELAGAFTHAQTVDPSGHLLGERFLPFEFRGKEIVKLDFASALRLVCKYGNFFTCPSALVRTDIYARDIQTWNGGRYRTSADLDVWLRLLERRPVAFLTKPLMGYRVSEASTSVHIARARIERHDLFLVLEDWLGRAEVQKVLTDEDRRNLQFLNYKDEAFRSLNIMRRGLANEPWPGTTMPLAERLRAGLQSSYHLRFLIYASLIQALKPAMTPAVRRIIARRAHG